MSEERVTEIRGNGDAEPVPGTLSETATGDTIGEIPLYDADAQQRIPFYIEEEGARLPVAYILDAQTDAAIAEYERLSDVRFHAADQEASGERNAMEKTDNSLQAALWLLNDRLVDAEGFGAPGEDRPDDWREHVFNDDRDREAVIDVYLAAEVIPLPLAPLGKVLSWKRKRKLSSAIRVAVYYSGYQLTLTHERTESITADHIDEFNSIKKSRYLVQGTKAGQGEIRVPPKARRLAALYNQLKYKTVGYAGRVPLHHKMLVVEHDLSGASASVRKN